jgi:hypothetical protein
MMTLWQMPAVVMTLVTWFTSPPANLAEVAQREALRRSLTPQSIGSFTNDNLRPDFRPMPVVPGVTTGSDVGAVATATGEAQAATAGEATSASGTAATEGASAAGGDEKAWRSRMAEARAQLDRDQGLADAMQSRINALQNDIVNRDDPAQQGALRQTLAKALAELERLRAQVATDQKAITGIQEDARRQGVPPGWVR